MKTSTGKFGQRSRRSGLTLIEVVAALAILGTLLVGVVLAKSRHTHQRARAEVVSQATHAADVMLEQWWQSGRGVPAESQGVLESSGVLTWRTRVLSDPLPNKVAVQVVRLEIYSEFEPGQRAQGPEQPILFVDLVVPAPRPQPAGGRP